MGLMEKIRYRAGWCHSVARLGHPYEISLNRKNSMQMVGHKFLAISRSNAPAFRPRSLKHNTPPLFSVFENGGGRRGAITRHHHL
jgi:hypothetical protein